MFSLFQIGSRGATILLALAGGLVWTVGAYRLGYQHCRSGQESLALERNLKAVERDAEIRARLDALDRQRKELLRDIEESCTIPEETLRKLEAIK